MSPAPLRRYTYPALPAVPRVITIATFIKPEDAHLMRMHLESAGIDAYVQDENLYQIYMSSAGAVRLEVADEDAQAARAFLASDQGLP